MQKRTVSRFVCTYVYNPFARRLGTTPYTKRGTPSKKRGGFPLLDSVHVELIYVRLVTAFTIKSSTTAPTIATKML